MATGITKTKWNGVADLIRQPPSNDIAIQLTYEGKKPEAEVLSSQPARTRTLWSGAREDNSTANHLYFGDNYPILLNLLDSLAGKVKLIYIDPPFATKSVFESRSQIGAYSDLLDGAQYVEFMRERLIVLRELLSDDGSIYVHLDGNMAFHIKVLMDEVFGRKNFRNWITRKKCHPKNSTRRSYGKVSDYILFYSKSDEYTFNRSVEPWTTERATKEYQYVEEGTGRRYKKVPVHAPGTRNGKTGQPWRGVNPPPGKHWQFTPETLDEMDARGEIYWSPTGNPRRKIYLSNSSGVPVQDIWNEFLDAHNQNIEITGYPTEKNSAMIARMIEASSNPGELVLDCFSGSGTTLAVAERLGRKWIGIDSSVEALTTTLRRFSTGTERMGDFVSSRNLEDNDEGASQGELGLYPSSVNDHQPQTAARMTTNFSLHVTEDYSGELDAVIDEWRS